MKFWLIVFLSTTCGEYVDKVERIYSSKVECKAVRSEVLKKFKLDGYKVEAVCVSDDHYNGRSVDRGVALD